MKNTKNFFSTGVALAALLFTSINVSAAENRNQTFAAIFNAEKNRIVSLPAFTIAKNKFAQFQKDIEEYKQIMEREMKEDKEYQQAFADIKSEIQKSVVSLYQRGKLSEIECTELEQALNNAFFPEPTK